MPNSSHSPDHTERLALVIDRARADNGVPVKVSRRQLSSDLASLFGAIFSTDDTTEDQTPTAWDMIAEETPTATRRYKVFTKALEAKDPLEALRKLSHDRSPSEMYLLQVKINASVGSKLSNIEKDIPELKTANWNDLPKEQKKRIFRHLLQIESHYRKAQSKALNATGQLINEAVVELADLFAQHTHFDGIPTDLPYSATSRFIQFTCLALSPVDDENKLTPGAVSKRWRRIKRLSDSKGN